LTTGIHAADTSSTGRPAPCCVLDGFAHRQGIPEHGKCFLKGNSMFFLIKSRLEISPVFVKRDDQVQGGSTHLLMLGV
jgi:hypothetical protein